MKKEVSAAKSDLRELKKALLDKLDAKRRHMSPEENRKVVMDTFYEDLADLLTDYVQYSRSMVAYQIEVWWDKYSTSLSGLQALRVKAYDDLDFYMKRLGYDE